MENMLSKNMSCHREPILDANGVDLLTEADGLVSVLPSRATLRAAMTLYPPTHQTYIAYGTSGFRGPAELLPMVAHRCGMFAGLLSMCLSKPPPNKLKEKSTIFASAPYLEASSEATNINKRVGTAVGAVVTASHNKHSDNGLKLTTPGGDMLPQECEQMLEHIVNAHLIGDASQFLAQDNWIDGALEAQVDAFFHSAKKLIARPTLFSNFIQYQNGCVLLGRDTRESSVSLETAFADGATAVGAIPINLGIVATGQLQLLVPLWNEAIAGRHRESQFPLLPSPLLEEFSLRVQETQLTHDGLKNIGESLKALYFTYVHLHLSKCEDALKNVESGASGKPVTAPVFCDAANGAGAEGAVLVGLQLTEICGQQIAVRNTGRSPSCHPVVPSDVPRDTLDSSTSLINERCGSEVVHMQKILPQQFGFAGDPSERECCCSLDGDADRLIFWQWKRTLCGVDVTVLDGDRIAALFTLALLTSLKAALEQTKASNVDEPLIIGVVQTAYSNGGSTKFFELLARQASTWKGSLVKLEISCVRTGVKHLHQEAQHFPVAVYFESNGHGTVTCRRDEVHHWGIRAGVTENPNWQFLWHFLNVFNPVTGDALLDLVAVTLARRRLGLTMQQWIDLYDDFPYCALKVPLPRHFLKTLRPHPDHEKYLIEPKKLQASITALVEGTGPFSRAFIRASGTEDVCRVYAETPDASEAQILAEKVKVVVVEFSRADQEASG